MNILSAFGSPTPTESTITHIWNCRDLGDSPDSHRWRANWHDIDGTPHDIELTAYPVIRLTPQGAQIDPDAYRAHETNGMAWRLSGEKRFVTNTGGHAWAKPTQEAALRSIAIRLERWARHVRHDINRIEAAVRVIHAVCPDDAQTADNALSHISLLDPPPGSDYRIARTDESALIGLVMKLTGGSASPDVVKAQIEHARKRIGL